MDQVALIPKTSAVTKQVSEKVFFSCGQRQQSGNIECTRKYKHTSTCFLTNSNLFNLSRSSTQERSRNEQRGVDYF